ncbi:Zn-dependent peptidase ImmA (M78 family)/transcriptional regulator with XRE-family HTH domain [Mycetocola sp. BIGb0189]|uniref:XRE family transcriptional regulator n=1 Tax=Mycetocola sp. BIGb0189 TaxID=2940604 RepID=UPI002167B735|nr:XRE family transcriptional regulator [Mycetocola sp. BIGb0189]MCS4277799.1 Zn-dependent peptidase ImmA (M78 family)/transcriptional regulator with XRE-family HTH domain [Mycetocola sp. BIGb0189]
MNLQRTPDSVQSAALSNEKIAETFDGDRLKQARQLALRTKQDIANAIGVSPAAIGQYEANAIAPRPELITALADVLEVLPEFFAAGRPQSKLESGDAFFRSLRATTARQRAKATSYTEQVWELVNTIERHVRLPMVNLPDFQNDRMDSPKDPVSKARSIRQFWGLNGEPISHLVRLLESYGIVAVLVPMVEHEVARIDAFSTLAFGRPMMVLSLDKADDVFRHRFTAAHELGHILMHGEFSAGDPTLEREADRFAAEFLMPSNIILDELPRRFDMRKLARLSERWGVSIQSLIYRSKELGIISDSAARRAYIKLNDLKATPMVAHRPVHQYPGEVPGMLAQAIDLAGTRGVTIASIAAELAWRPARVRQLLGEQDTRPTLTLV